jgi:MFS family permease
MVTVVEIFMLYYLMKETYNPREHASLKRGELTKSYSRDRFFVIFIVIGIILGFFMRQRGSTFTVYTIYIQHLPFLYLGYVWALNGFLVVILQFPLLRMMTKYGNSMLWRGVGSLFYAVGFLFLTYTPTLGILLAFMAISTFGEDLVSPTTQSIITTIAPDNMRGSYIGVYNLYTSIGGFAGAIIGMYLLFVLENVSATYWIYIALGSVIVGGMYVSISRLFSKRFSTVVKEESVQPQT